MNKRIGLFAILGISALLLGLLGAITALAAPAGVVGSVKFDRAWTNLAQTVKVTVTDTDEDKPIAQVAEAQDLFNAAYGTGAGANASLFGFKVREGPIQDWVDYTATNCCGTGLPYPTINDFLAAFGLTQDNAISTADLDAVNKPGGVARKNGVVDGSDVIVNITGRTLAIYSIDAFNGIITFRIGDSVGANTAFTLTYFGSVANTVSAKLSSRSDTTGFTRTLTETARSSGIFEATFTLSADASSATTATLKAADGDVITAEYTDVSEDSAKRSAFVNVELTKPILGSLSPATKSHTKSKEVTLSTDVTDSLSGVKSTTIRFWLKVAGDVAFLEVKDSDTATDDVALKFNTNKYVLTDITGGKRATVKVEFLAGDGTYSWYAVSDDNAGNTGLSKGDPDLTTDGAANPATIVLDTTALAVGTDAASGGASAVTGQWWDPTKTGAARLINDPAKAKNTSIRVVFDGDIDCASVAAVDFKVKDVAPAAAECFSGLLNSVFLSVPALGPSETPKVEVVLGGVSDKAGNANTAVLSVATARDGIAPKLTATLTGDAAVAGVPVSAKSVTVRVSTNETLLGTPKVEYVGVTSVAGILVKDGVLADAGSVTFVGTDTWERKLTIESLLPGGGGKLFVLKVSGADATNNTGVTGGDDPAATGALLLELDASIPALGTAAANLLITPADKADVFRTDPFITVNWTAEGSEYNGDSHKKITLTVAKLDSADVLAKMATPDNRTFILATSGLALGSHTFEVNGTDEVGNKLAADAKVTFTVKETAKVEVPLKPGQNLVSVPGEPQDPTISNVLAGTDVVAVVAYDPLNPDKATGSPWLTATKGADGRFTGSLTKIDAKHGYWMQTSSFVALKVFIPPQGFAAVPPSIALVAGWNLVPVVSLTGQAPGTLISADLYLGSTAWVTAYTYDPETNAWTKVLPKNFQNVTVGKGYWLYVTSAGILVP
ncbi:MAG: hypothetical protein HY535_08790 [Chloroflexi bacterium]|nr:hypothetical protein [Chloroflexota bacterium]